MAVVAGERRIVTVLFADIVDSTAIGERLGPERSKLLVDEVMRLMSAQIEQFEGTVAQYVGDELYAVFGAPVAHEDDSERAVRAALAIQEALATYRKEVEEAYGIDLAVRIAINTGPVVIRPDSEDPYNALGETVNVAARIQKLVEGGQIVVGRSTKLHVDGCFELETLGEQDLRGLSEPVETFRVMGVRERTEENEALPLVGRDFELSVLERAMDGLAEGRGVVVSIVGEPGIGKTRLAAEVRRRFSDRILFLEGRAVSYARSIPYWPVRELVRDLLGLGASEPEARVRLELKAELRRLLGDDADGAYPLVASLLGITLEPDAHSLVRDLSRESRQQQTFEAMREVVERLSAESSVCLVVEDLHWADESTLELLQALLPVTEEAAVGLVLLYRSERDHGSWRLGEHARQRYPHRYREIELRPLPDDASRTLATAAAGAELPESVADLLAMRAGGNPYFLEEALHDLIERGALQRSDGHYVLAVDASELSVPALVQGALQARLDRLGRETRDVVSVAAVIGRAFELPLLEEVLPEQDLLPALTELQRLDLVVERRRRPVAEYSFRHGLVQEVAYAGLVEGKRRKLHRLVGEALERLGGASIGVLARHFAEADEPEKAAEYLLRAGDAARALYADQEAVEHYSRARGFLARLGDDARMRETLFKIALARHLVFDFEGAEDAYDEAFCCRVEEPAPPAPTERLVTTTERLHEIVPGDVYTVESLQITELLFRGLLAVDDAMTVVPDVADNFRVSSDGLTYLFRLREGVRWSDGEPLTAGDFVYAWDRLREENRPTAFLLADIESAEALDDRTLEVRAREPRSYFPYLLASWALPWPRHRCEELGDDWRRPENLVTNGPFTLAELTDRRALLVANRYWIGPHGNVREIEIEFVASDGEMVDGWRNGRFDVATVHDDRARDAPDTVPVEASLLSLNFLGFRADRPPFSNELLRRAFAHALDRSRLAPSFGALARLATRGGALPPAMPGHSPRAGIEHDPQAARALLAEAGHPEGRGLPPLTLRVPDWLERPETLVDQWAELGIEVDVQSGLGVCETDLGDADLFVAGWTADFPDPDGLFLGLYGGRDWPLYADDEIDELLRQARRVPNQSERMRLFHEIDRTWVRDRAALVPLTYKRMLLLQRPWVEGVTLNALGRTNLACAVLSRPSRNGS